MNEQKHISRVVPGDRVRNVETGIEGTVASTDPGCAQLRLVDDPKADPTAYRPNERAREVSQHSMQSWSLFEHVPELTEVQKSEKLVADALKARDAAHAAADAAYDNHAKLADAHAAAADAAYDNHAKLADAHAELVERTQAAEVPPAAPTSPELPIDPSKPLS